MAGQAEDFYVSQTGGGGTNSLAWLNDPANWGLGDGRISPGDIVHLTGLLTNRLDIAGSGISGNPVTIRFEPGAKFSAPYWNPAIRGASVHYLTIDGGLDGRIEATDNGTLLGLRNPTKGVSLEPCGDGMVISNLSIINLFQKVVLPDGNPTNAQPDIRGIWASGSGIQDLMICNNTIVHAGNAITINYNGSCTNVLVLSNYLSDVSFGVFINCNGAGYSRGFEVSRNVCKNLATYDGNWGSQSGEHNHNNFLIVNSTAVATNRGLRVDGNVAGSNSGKWVTSLIKITPDHDTFRDALVVNNLLVSDTAEANISNGYISAMLTPNLVIANNTLANVAAKGASAMGIKVGNTTSVHIYNNAFLGVTMNLFDDVSSGSGSGVVASDYNRLNGLLRDSAFYGHGATFRTVADWVSGTGFDKRSTTNSTMLNGRYAPLTNDLTLPGAGTNLSAYFTSDFDGRRRPGWPTNWTIGAFEASGSVRRPRPATSLTNLLLGPDRQ